MGKLWCIEGEHEVKVRFQPTSGERYCPEHGGELRSLPRKPMEKIQMECLDCGRVFERRKARPGSGKCIPCAHKHRPLRVVECVGCGETFETKEQEKKYCSKRCYLSNGPGPTDEMREKSAAIGRERTGVENPNYRHGRRVSQHERRLHREFNLDKKGEHTCRVCASERTMHAHHAVPRSLSRLGKYDLRNCLPLCAVCHTRWHRRSLTIYRDVFTETEWEFISTLINPGWLNERYPDRGRPFRDEEMERVAECLPESVPDSHTEPAAGAALEGAQQ